MRKIQMHAGIAMIELIFAIVIMGIVFMSAPMIISTATKSAYVAMQQESISAAASEIGMILTRHWDEGDTDENLSAPILQAAGDSDLNEATYPDGNGTGVRAGSSIYSKRNFLTSAGGGRLDATLSGNFTTEADFDDVDDFNGNDTILSVYNSENIETSIGDYIDTDINIRTTVSYIDDTLTSGTYAGASSIITLDNPFNRGSGAGTTSNIKLVNIRLTTSVSASELEKTIILNAFTCNIGTYELDKRSF